MDRIAALSVSKWVASLMLMAGTLAGGCTARTAPPEIESTRQALSGPAPVLTATSPNASTVVLSWNDVTGEDGYYVDRSTNGGLSFTQVQSLAPNAVTWSDTGRSALTTYCYRVRAYDGEGSSPSNTSCVLTPKSYEAESLNSTTSGSASVVSNPEASGGSLVSAVVSQNGWLKLTTTTPATGVYGTQIRYLATPDGGTFVVKVGDVPYGNALDGHADSPTFREAYLGEVEIVAANTSRVLTFELTSPLPATRIQIDAITMVVAQLRYEAESLSVTTSNRDKQSDSSVTGASNGKVNVATLNASGDHVSYTLAVRAPGTYSISLQIRKGPNRGRFRAWLDGTTALGDEVDGYASSNTLVVVPLGEIPIALAGNHTLKLQASGKNPSSSSYGITVDRIDLRLATDNGCRLFGDALPDGTACNDANLCTQDDVCQSGICAGSTTVTCTATDQCHQPGVCDPTTGQCSSLVKPDGVVCDDGNGCTQTDTCQTGICTGANPVTCAAKDQCHEAGTCDQATGQCTDPAKPDGTICNDGNACTQTDSCQAGICSGSNVVTCAASDECHEVGTCDPGTGQCSSPAKPNGSACNDGNPCTRLDTCQVGICTGADPVICTPSDQCHEPGVCDQATGTCSNPAKPDGAVCSDGSPCTQTDTCQAGACTGANLVTCTASDQCHDAGTCDQATGQCSNPAKPDNTACNDGNACTLNDFCQAGTCAGRDPVVCSDWGPCYEPAVCDPELGNCRATAKADGTSCDDGNACTQADSCQAGMCTGSNPVTCSARDQCHQVGTCDQTTGQCSNPPKIGACLRNSPKISAGFLHTCAIRVDGSIACWGSNNLGQATPPAGTFTEVSAGEGITCALKTDGTPQCWGDANGPIFPTGETFVQISAGSRGACGLKPEGWVQCWGHLYGSSYSIHTQIAAGLDHGCGVLEDGSLDCWGEIDWGLPNPPAGTFVQVVAGAHRSCALRTDGTAACWGQDAELNPPPALTFERLAAAGTTTCGLQTSGEIACWGTGTLAQLTPPAGPFVNLTVGNYHACATRSDDSSVCWGADVGGSDPMGAATLPGRQVLQVSNAMDSGCTLDVINDVSCWGTRRFPPPPASFRQISVSQNNGCGILIDGTGVCWCDPNSNACIVPAWAAPFTQVAVSDDKVCWLNSEGVVACTMGYQYPPPGVYKQITVGGTVACAVRSDDTAVCWGEDFYGKAVPPEGTWKQLSVGGNHSCGIKTDDTAVCWGDNSYGQGTPPVGSYSAIAAGYRASCGIRTDGTIACWGVTMSTSNPPNPPPGPFLQLSVGMGSDTFCATSTSGQEWCWGEVARQPLACALEPDGACISTDYVMCAVSDQCHTPGEFDPATRRCTNPALPDGTSCNDGTACTQADTCQAGVCAGANPVVCGAGNECQTSTCDPQTGQCVVGMQPDGTSCNDFNGCTQTDTCQSGWCMGSNEVQCPISNDPCTYTSMCDPMTGQCGPSTTAYNGSYCDDGNGCTLNDTCQNGVCAGGDPVVCAGEGDCYQAGTCDPAVGQCSYPAKAEGASCDDRNPCTQSDVCQFGACSGTLSGGTCEAPTGGSLAAGTSHTCALRSDGTIACWGMNYWGESSPPMGTFKQVVAGNSFTCALRTDGTPQCWGNNLNGQTNARPGPYTQLISGDLDACGLTATGQAECWGSGYYGFPSGSYSQIAMGYSHGCGLRSDGSITCWGGDWAGQTASPAGTGYRKVAAGGAHSCAITAEGSAVCWGHLHGTPPAGPFTDIVAGYEHTCAMRSNGTVACWGPTYGSPPPGGFVAMAAGSNHTCAMRGDGTVACWGQDGSGQSTVPTKPYVQVTAGMQFCGLASNGSVDCWGQMFQVLPPEGTFVQVAGGVFAQCGIKTDGSLACWDINPYDPWSYQQPVPTGTFTQLSVGEAAACAVRDSGTLECWGQLIGNSYFDTPASNDFVEVAVGRAMACARKISGNVVCWGNNISGTPAVAFTQISAGEGHACGLRTDGSLACWGDNWAGQSSPPAGNDFVQVAAFRSRSCALTAQGAAVCWGDTLQGDAFADKTRIGPLLQITLGYDATCALNATGQELCWGNVARQPLSP